MCIIVGKFLSITDYKKNREIIGGERMSKIIWAIDEEGYPPFPKNEIWFLNSENLYFSEEVRMKNKSEVYNEGFVSGYNQCRVDKGEITQEKADDILQKFHTKKAIDLTCKTFDDNISTITNSMKCEEAYMKKAVFILLPTTKDNIEGYIVKGWENVLKYRELPEEYCDKWHVFAFWETQDGKAIFIQLEEKMPVCIVKEMFCSKEDWNKWYYQPMLQAGHRLSKILEEQRKPKIIRVEI